MGSLYRLTARGVFTTMFTFGGISGADGAYPLGVVQKSDGLLSGTTFGTPSVTSTLFTFDPLTFTFHLSSATGGSTRWGPPVLDANNQPVAWYYKLDSGDVPIGLPLPVGFDDRIGVVSQSSGINILGQYGFVPFDALQHYSGASNPQFRLAAGLIVGPDGSWYSVGSFPSNTDSYIVRVRPQVTLWVAPAPRNPTPVDAFEYMPPFGAPPTPLVAGRPSTWTANVRGLSGQFEYRWWVRSDAGWSLVTPYDGISLLPLGGSNTLEWTPASAGHYALQVWVRRVGSMSPYQAFQSTTTFEVLPPDPITVTLTQNLGPDGHITGFSAHHGITATDGATGGVGPLQYQFWVLEPGTGWRIVQPWSYRWSVDWTPPRNGSYVAQVWVRSANSTALYQAWSGYGPFTITDANQLRVVDVPHDAWSPYIGTGTVGPGSTVTWTASTVGGDGSPLEYQFFRYSWTTHLWELVRSWEASASYAWTPNEADAGAAYYVQVWVRRQGSAASWEAWGNGESLAVSLSGLSVYAALNDRQSLCDEYLCSSYLHVPAGAPVRWRAAAIFARGPVEFAFWRLNVLTGVWTLVQPYGVSDTYTWTPSTTEAGAYQIQIWVRHVGSGAGAEATKGYYFTIDP